MSTIDIKKLSGYSLIVGPIIALICYFIQPGGVLGIGGRVDPTDFEAGAKILTENSVLGILTGLLIPAGLITLLSGLLYFIESLKGGNGYALAKLGAPFIFIAITGWTVGSAIAIGISNGIITGTNMGSIFFSINIPSTMLFGLGGIFIALGAASRQELNSRFAYVASVAATLVFITAIILAFAPEQGNTISLVTGICFIIYTFWSISIGRGMTK
jgi:hypothetical protein